MDKIAIDEGAKKYWQQLYGEYGEALVRDIPRRIKAALVATRKIASINDTADIWPSAVVSDDTGSIVEGVYLAESSKFLFSAKLNTDGEVQDIATFEIR